MFFGGTPRKIWRHTCASQHTGWEPLVWTRHLRLVATRRFSNASTAMRCVMRFEQLEIFLIAENAPQCGRRMLKRRVATSLNNNLIFRSFASVVYRNGMSQCPVICCGSGARSVRTTPRPPTGSRPTPKTAQSVTRSLKRMEVSWWHLIASFYSFLKLTNNGRKWILASMLI